MARRLTGNSGAATYTVTVESSGPYEFTVHRAGCSHLRNRRHENAWDAEASSPEEVVANEVAAFQEMDQGWGVDDFRILPCAYKRTASRRNARRLTALQYEPEDRDLLDSWLLSFGLGTQDEDAYRDAQHAWSSGASDAQSALQGAASDEVEDIMYQARYRMTQADGDGIPLMAEYWHGVYSYAKSLLPAGVWV